MERTYLQWNIVNWITIFLMVSVGYMIVAAAAQGYHKWSAQ